jgi:hypothetical protein
MGFLLCGLLVSCWDRLGRLLSGLGIALQINQARRSKSIALQLILGHPLIIISIL